MAKQTIAAFYDSREDANNAALMLRQAGIPDADVVVSPETAAAGYANDAEPRAKGFWASLEDMFGGTDDHSTYAEGLRRGGTLLTVHVDDARVDDAARILEQHGSIDLDERETTWRGEGWSGNAAITGGGIANEGAGPLRAVSALENSRDDVVAPLAAAPAPAPIPTATTATTARATGRDDVIQVVEESLNVGKRAVNRGKVRIHSYVVETPVTEAVSLRDETVTIDRRPVDRLVTTGELGVDPFQDRTIEMDEIDEEAVVAKTTRVVEEIGIRKEAMDRTQTITDTVRSTKVDIEDGRVAGATPAAFADASLVQRAKDMEVLGSDGAHVGVIDHVDGSTIKLKRVDPASGGSHHLIPADWVQTVDQKVRLKVTADEAKSRWVAA